MSTPRFDTIKQRLAAGWKFALSFRTHTWKLQDFPISIVRQRTDLDLGHDAPRYQRPHAYLARIVNWWVVTGSGDTPQEAMRELGLQFDAIRTERQREGKSLPRPGTEVPIEFASQRRVGAHPELAEDFVRRVLGLDWAWISDESSLWDFHTEGTNDALYAKIKDVYGVDVSDVESGRLSEILDRIAEAQS
jgi:hypothetical protein